LTSGFGTPAGALIGLDAGGSADEALAEGLEKRSSGVDPAAARWLAGVMGSTLVGAHKHETWRLASEDDAAARTQIV
jgi:hypothetical protein